jgi:2-dehydropantoate 2-reductase
VKIAVFGAGAVGAYFGGRLAAAGEDVHFIARGRTLDALRRGGLSIVSPRGDLELSPVSVADRPEAIGPVDVVLFAVKLYDAEAAAAALAPLIGPSTVVVTLQNGVEVVDLVARHVGRSHVAGGVAYIVANVEEPGRIRHTTAHRLIFGERDGSLSARLQALESAGQRAGFEAALSTTIEVDLWVKFARLATWAGLTTVTRSAIGTIREDPALMELMSAALDEAIAVGRARGIAFPAALPAETRQLVDGFPRESRSSMLDDLTHGRPLELPWLSGAVVRLGRERGVPTPIHGFITTVLGPFVRGTGIRTGGEDDRRSTEGP